MLSETVKLEKLRQKIEDLRYESGDRANFLDYGKPTAEQAKQAQEKIKKLDVEIKAGQAELKHLLDSLRAQQPQAVEEWVNYHIALLQGIAAETSTDRNAGTRKYVANETIKGWEKVRAGEIEYVDINGSFLKDYKDHVRSFNENSQPGDFIQAKPNQPKPSQAKSEDKSWWQFWK